MPTSTANYGLVKAAPTENYDVAVVNANLDTVDSVVKAADSAYKAADTAIKARLDALEALVSGTVAAPITNAFTAGPNFTIVEQSLYTWGGICFLKMTATRTTSALASNTDGNITNTEIMKWAAGNTTLRPGNNTEVGIAGAEAGMIWGGYINATNVAINALLPGLALNVGDSVRGTAMWIRAL